jgi:ribosome biogenesis GTPase A
MAEEYGLLKQSTNELIQDYNAFLHDLLDPDSSQGIVQQDTVLSEYYALRDFESIKKRHDASILSVALLSLTKSGKSTFINALLGMDCMPMGTGRGTSCNW